jgi:hypothetical protein
MSTVLIRFSYLSLASLVSWNPPLPTSNLPVFTTAQAFPFPGLHKQVGYVGNFNEDFVPMLRKILSHDWRDRPYRWAHAHFGRHRELRRLLAQMRGMRTPCSF